MLQVRFLAAGDEVYQLDTGRAAAPSLTLRQLSTGTPRPSAPTVRLADTRARTGIVASE